MRALPSQTDPDLLLVGRHGVVGQEGGGDRAGCPAELQALLGLPALDQTVEDAADGRVAATDAVEHADVTGLCDIELAARPQNRAPQMMVGVDDLGVVAKTSTPGKRSWAVLIMALKPSIFAPMPLPPASGPSRPSASWKSSSLPIRMEQLLAISVKPARIPPHVPSRRKRGS